MKTLIVILKRSGNAGSLDFSQYQSHIGLVIQSFEKIVKDKISPYPGEILQEAVLVTPLDHPSH